MALLCVIPPPVPPTKTVEADSLQPGDLFMGRLEGMIAGGCYLVVEDMLVELGGAFLTHSRASRILEYVALTGTLDLEVALSEPKDLRLEVQGLLREDRAGWAEKRVREETGCGYPEAKEYVEGIRRGETPRTPKRA